MPIQKTFGARLAMLQLVIASLAISAVLLTMSLDIFLRGALNSGFSSTIEIVSFYYMVPIAFLPIATLEFTDSHIRTDLFYKIFPKFAKVASDLIAAALSIGIYSLLSWVTFKQAMVSTKAGELAMGVALLPVWPVRWILPFAFATSAVIALLIVISRLKTDRRND